MRIIDADAAVPKSLKNIPKADRPSTLTVQRCTSAWVALFIPGAK